MAFNRHVKMVFDNLQILYDRLGIFPLNIWNLLPTKLGRAQCRTPVEHYVKVVPSRLHKSDLKSAESMPLFAVMHLRSRQISPPAHAFPWIRYKNQMLRKGPRGSLGLANSPGWMKSDIFPIVLKHFISDMNVSKQNPSVLIMGNQCSYITLEVINTARENSLSILTTPPHCSHKLQPQDVRVFEPFKTFYSKSCSNWH